MHELPEVLDQIWSALSDGCAHARDAFHTPTVATVRDARPEIRTVVLRYVDRELGVLGFHTDRRSPKLRDLAASSELTWHFYDRGRKTQIRARGSATVHLDDDVADEAWKAVTPLGRRCYGQALGPGTPSDGPLVELPSLAALEANDRDVVRACRENFGVVRSRLVEIDRLVLAFDGHRRARFTRTSNEWSGAWIAP